MPVVPGIRLLEIVVRACANFATNFAKFRSEIAQNRYAALQIRNSRGSLLPPSEGGGSVLDLHDLVPFASEHADDDGADEGECRTHGQEINIADKCHIVASRSLSIHEG